MPPPAPPSDAALEAALARLLTDRDRDALARALAEPRFAPGSPAACIVRGEIARRAGDAEAAAALLDEGVRALPGVIAARHAAALAHLAARRPDAARAHWLALLERAPGDRVARYQIALTLQDERRPREAAHWYAQQLAQEPADARAWHNLALCRQALGEGDAAVEALRRAVESDATRLSSWLALGMALRAAGRAREAIEALARAHALAPGELAPRVEAAQAWSDLAELPSAIALLDEAIALAPRDAPLRWNAAAALSALGRHAEAMARLREAQAIDPGDARGASAVLVEMHYERALATREALARAHWAWGDRHAAGLAPIHARPGRPRARPDSVLRVGYVSPRFGAGPLASLFLPVLRAHDPRRVSATLYAAHAHDDEAAAAMRAACTGFRTLPGDDEAAARTIAEDRLDLVVDLAGHSPGHRLLALARRPAPVIASWLDYFETTGVPGFDYLVSDAIHTPPSEAALVRERLALLPGCRFVYAPDASPPASPPPAARNGFVTFGCFNRHAKITAETLALWCAVLAAVPGSRLRLRASAYRGAGTVAWVRRDWASRGVPVERIDFLPYLPLGDALADYANVDVALDTVPYNGGVTTCDALAAGVPVVALRGDRIVARQGASLLRAAGRASWVARDDAAYVDLASSLADPSRLADVRERLAHDVPRSPLCDVPAFVGALERLFARMVDAGPRDPDDAAPPPLLAD